MNTLACKDIVDPDCHYVAEGETEHEVEKDLLDHAMEKHPEKLRTLLKTTTDSELKRKMRSEIDEDESWDVG